MDERYPETPGVNHPPGIPRDYLPRPMPISNSLCHSGVGLASNISASRYTSTASTAGNLSSSSYPASSSPYLPVPPYPVSTSTYRASSNSIYPRCVSPYPPSSSSQYPVSTSSYLHASSNKPYPESSSSYLHASSNKPYPASNPSYLHASSNRPYPASNPSYLHASSNRPYPASSSSYRHASSNKPYPASGSPYADRSNRHYAASYNSPYPVPTSVYPDSSNIHYDASFNSPYPIPTSVYPDSSNRHYVASFNRHMHSNKHYAASSSSYLHPSSNKPYPASGSPYADRSNRHYAARCNSSYSTPTSLYTDRHYPASPSIKQLPSSFPYPSIESRGYTSKFEPSVDETNNEACYINALPNEIILNIFNYLTQNQLARVARVCRKWSVLKKSPALWRKVNVQIFCSSGGEGVDESFKSLIDGLPSCVTFIKLDFVKRGYFNFSERLCYDLKFEELCMKLHQKCPRVETLILARCGMSTSLPGAINSCTRFLQGLKKLVLRYCRFNDYRTVITELEDNSKIEVLDLNRSDFFYYRKIHFSKLHSLKELRLASTRVNDACFVGDTFFLNHLQALDLGWTDVTASTFRAIQRHGQNLKELYLCHLRLNDDHFDFNGPVFPHLQTICLSDNYVTCELLVSLVRSCPSLVSVYVCEDVARSFAEHPFLVANRCKSGIVKGIDWKHDHDVDYSPN